MTPTRAKPSFPRRTRGLGATIDAVERDQILEALDESIWNVTRAARQLGISRDTLRYRIAKHQLRPGGHRAPQTASAPRGVRDARHRRLLARRSPRMRRLRWSAGSSAA